MALKNVRRMFKLKSDRLMNGFGTMAKATFQKYQFIFETKKSEKSEKELPFTITLLEFQSCRNIDFLKLN